MYSMDPDKLPKKPLVVSQASANQELARWLQHNDYHHLTDGAGLKWDFRVEETEIPDPSDRYKSVRQLRMLLSTTVNAGQLLATGTLKVGDDERLCGLLGDENILLRMRPIQEMASSLDHARKILMDHITALRTKLENDPLHEVKRQLVGRWLDERQAFGGSKT